MKEAIKEKVAKILEDELRDIERDLCDEGESELSHNIRKMHYKAELRVIERALNDAFKPMEATAIHTHGKQDYYMCPACYSNITDIDDKDAWRNQFCRACGQPLDWSGLGFDTSSGKKY